MYNKHFDVTTEHIDDVNVLVRVYKKGEKKIFNRFIVEDYGDWNAVEDTIEYQLKVFEKNLTI